MNKEKNSFPLRHISIRVPWHDNKWNGSVCQFPAQNSACLKLPRIAKEKNESAEEKIAGKLISEINQNDWPPCVGERMAFMASFEYTRFASHPYTRTSAGSHGHFKSTPLRHPSYSAAAVPFRWMIRKDMEEFAHEYDLEIDPNWEPELGFSSGWVQDHRNQKALLNCFFKHIVPEKSLCFFYAKQVPFVEDSRRIIVGVGRVNHIGNTTEYDYSEKGELRSVLWERMIQHSIRPEFRDGFLLPYHDAIELSESNPDFDPATIAAFAPEDGWEEFSYGSEHVTNDAALSSLLSCASALKTAAHDIDGPWEQCQKWIDNRMGELWKMRGPCPGLGAALSAFGIELGTFVAREIDTRTDENEDPWPLTDKLLQDPKSYLGDGANRIIGDTIRETWMSLNDERRNLLKLISRFDISPEQAKQIYVQEERMKSELTCSDEEIIQNPYLIYEFTRLSLKPVSVWTVDRGVFPDTLIRDKHPLPEPSYIGTGIDARRIRALFVNKLESAASFGHTLQSRSQLILGIREQSIQPPCEVTSDTATTAEKNFDSVIEVTILADGEPAYQLTRLFEMGQIIRGSVKRRLSGKPFVIDEDWRALLDKRLGKVDDHDQEQELKAREEKVEALKVLAASRFSVLIGPAGTGKTTLLSTLCCQEQIAKGGILLLAPTGKARVRMEQAVKESGISISGLTIAQFLGPSDRYDYKTGQYRLSGEKASAPAETVIVDEASMLTEEMTGALIEALRGTPRLIFIGDHRQLPPIGSGRPFVDIISELTPSNIESIFPRIGPGYAELTIRRRQAGTFREDLQLANWFSGSAISPGEDDVFSSIVASGSSEHLKFVEWNTPDEIGDKLLGVLVEELGLADTKDVNGFNDSLGATIVNGYRYFNVGHAHHAEAWQILSPIRNNSSGVISINRLIHKQFRSKMVEFALRRYNRQIPQPMGQELIVYGDKVINLQNHKHKEVYPEEGAEKYIANGEIGIAVGQFKTRKMTKPPWQLKVEFSSQPNYRYSFSKRNFGDEAEPTLELAYALTVHKAQGSEFGLLILILPNPCRLLSREMLYTALTRQRNRIVILHQGNRGDLKKYSSEMYAETALRLTNLFKDPMPVEIAGRFFEDRLINRTRRGELVRSKSEIIVADGLDYSKIDYEYEKALTINNVTKYPDFTIEDEETGNIFYWEHCGMLQNPEYRERWERKLKWYIENDIKPADEGGGKRGTLIITSDNEAGGISSQEIVRVIKQVIL